MGCYRNTRNAQIGNLTVRKIAGTFLLQWDRYEGTTEGSGKTASVLPVKYLQTFPMIMHLYNIMYFLPSTLENVFATFVFVSKPNE